ncbi:hypothetical protein [Fodinicurvata sp. EGI_FJ10296]|uniref:hypothetical protein n=1 Tax=Fodinicurvata sp. EGI_FJ10296 TaxID=3231908 RepID=UPI003455AB8F
MNNYSETKSLLRFIENLGWLSVVIGISLIIYAIASINSQSGAYVALVSSYITFGIICISTGIIHVAVVRVGLAIIDNAEHTGKILSILSKQSSAMDGSLHESTESNQHEGEIINKEDIPEGSRLYHNKIIHSIDNKYCVDGNYFSTLGMAKEYIKNNI